MMRDFILDESRTCGQVRDEDVQLMLKFKQGEISAFEALLDKYHNPIINFVYRFIGNKQESEDLAQEVFLRVYRSSQNYKPKAKFSTWIYRIAKNLVLNELRRRRTHNVSSLDEMVSFEEEELPKQISNNKPSALVELEKKDLTVAVRKAIDSLPANQKMAVVLKRYDELPYVEIAKILGCSVSAVKSLLNRAKVSLKEKLSSYVQE